ncbi:unnamed protein product [Ectocarpus sp. CCAP 1310/34]|nr:unnamed protein product [Ectocarpus sp. CCAP 1310/34]
MCHGPLYALRLPLLIFLPRLGLPRTHKVVVHLQSAWSRRGILLVTVKAFRERRAAAQPAAFGRG